MRELHILHVLAHAELYHFSKFINLSSQKIQDGKILTLKPVIKDNFELCTVFMILKQFVS